MKTEVRSWLVMMMLEVGRLVGYEGRSGEEVEEKVGSRGKEKEMAAEK